MKNKKHLKNVEPIRHNEPPHANSPDVASGTVARRLRKDVHDNDDNDNAWQRGPLWPHGMGPMTIAGASDIELTAPVCLACLANGTESDNGTNRRTDWRTDRSIYVRLP